MCIEKNKKLVEFNKKHVFKTFTIDKLDIGDIISNITMIFLNFRHAATIKKYHGNTEVDKQHV